VSAEVLSSVVAAIATSENRPVPALCRAVEPMVKASVAVRVAAATASIDITVRE
jgi:hypothetical protein